MRADTQGILDRLEIDTSAQIDVMQNRITVEVFDRAKVEATLRDADVQVSDAVTLVEIPTTQPAVAPTVDPAFGDIGFFRQLPADGPHAYPAALLEGTLQLTDGCLRLGDGPNAYVPLWMPDANLRDDNGTLTVVNGTGKVIGRVGERIALGGGTYPDDQWKANPDLPVKPSCAGPYWLVAP